MLMSMKCLMTSKNILHLEVIFVLLCISVWHKNSFPYLSSNLQSITSDELLFYFTEMLPTCQLCVTTLLANTY